MSGQNINLFSVSKKRNVCISELKVSTVANFEKHKRLILIYYSSNAGTFQIQQSVIKLHVSLLGFKKFCTVYQRQ